MGVPDDRPHGIASAHSTCPSKPSSLPKTIPRAPRATFNGLPAVSNLWPRCGHVRGRSARVPGPMRPTVPSQSTPCRLRFTLRTPDHFCETGGGPSELISQTITTRDGNQTIAREVSPWTPRCASRGARAADHGIEDERHARLRALSRSVGTDDEVPVTGRCRLLVNCAVSRCANWPGQRTSRTLPGVCNFSQTTGSDHHADRCTQQGPRRAPRAA
jgi:hypothetical protein